ncbi:MAG: hypothetical protein AAB472_02695 [Patescibacteria group bacterium]
MKQLLVKISALAFLLSPLAVAVPAYAAAAPNWNTSNNYVVAFDYQGTAYAHDLALVQDVGGNLTGNGGYPVGGAHSYTWVLTGGTVSGDTIDITANYTAPSDATTPLTVMHMTGTVASDGSMSGTWNDNYQGGVRSGTWTTTSGHAVRIQRLHAEDFGVVSYDTGLGMLRGYSAGFGLDGANFLGAQSVVVKLYSGATLLQTNTATAKVGTDITGNQISSPFDVSGTFNYLTDGYWVNLREAQYGQSVPATRVVATVTLANGTVVTAENTVLAGDPTTIYPIVVVPPPVTTPTDKDVCKKGGWKIFTNPTFKNQGQCVSFVEHAKKDKHENKEDKNHSDSDKHENKGHDND